VTKVLPPITPAKPAKPDPAANTSIQRHGTLWPKLSNMAGWVREAWMIQPKRVRTKTRYKAPSVIADTNIVKARIAGKDQQDIAKLLTDGTLYARDNARALDLAARSGQIDDELLGALERWETLGSPA
jgi:hypothetical protein